MHLLEKNVILRVFKPYAQARNHVYTGRLVHFDPHWVAMDGVVFNFGSPTTEDPSGGLTLSLRAERWLPRERVQYIRELEPEVDPFDLEKFRLTQDGKLTYRVTDRPDLIPE